MIKQVTTALAAICAATLLAQVDPARVVATVNGEEIKGSEYYQRMEFLPGVGKRQGTSFAEFPPGFLTLEQLITERLVFQLAKEKGVSPSDLEFQAEYRSRLEDNPDLLSTWTKGGRSEADLQYQVRYELALFKVQTAGITITDQQIAQFYKDNPDQYTVPKQYKLRVIVVDNMDARTTVDKELAGGKAFPDVAKAHSIDVTKAAGGDFGTLPVTVFAPDMRKAIEPLAVGQVSPWVGSEQDGTARYARFKVDEIIAAKKVELDAKLRRRIRREMMLQRGRAGNDVEKEMRALRAKSKVDIKQPQFAAAYTTYIEAYLKTAPAKP